ncbi:DUF4817 domain-containing protein [Trichonephila clavipes]|nr:DUF4817 domain-containing protein [Trichonephila clavipes]
MLAKQKYPDETAPNTSTITHLVLRIRNTGSIADKKRSGRQSIVNTKVADVETALQISLLKNSPKFPHFFGSTVDYFDYKNTITEFISLLNIDERYTKLQSKMTQRVPHDGMIWKLYLSVSMIVSFPKDFGHHVHRTCQFRNFSFGDI